MTSVNVIKEQIQKTVEINDDITYIIKTFVQRYNGKVDLLNSIIDSAKYDIESLNNAELKSMIPFMGEPRNHIKESDLEKLISGDYSLTQVKLPSDFIDEDNIDDLIPVIGGIYTSNDSVKTPSSYTQSQYNDNSYDYDNSSGYMEVTPSDYNIIDDFDEENVPL